MSMLASTVKSKRAMVAKGKTIKKTLQLHYQGEFQQNCLMKASVQDGNHNSVFKLLKVTMKQAMVINGKQEHSYVISPKTRASICTAIICLSRWMSVIIKVQSELLYAFTDWSSITSNIKQMLHTTVLDIRIYYYLRNATLHKVEV